ncbi:sensor histidine kinase [Idiomarina seosinensis]|uniref:histidine kinase n=1 Tax=Idiomarina seosinensis TaxID=281739 RepID=A0A432Z6X0_9GAMM|nr:HAMP domain-containing sensor histidine kinase [Idiomarina seosinensis]RUO73640.1 sensor histidine kinase [Idiomarina seosinensis]
MKPRQGRKSRWYQSLTLRLLLLFWALLFLTASSGYFLAVWNRTAIEPQPVADPIRRTVEPLLLDPATFLSLEPGRLLAGNYRIAARVMDSGQQRLMLDEYLGERYKPTLLRFLNFSQTMQMPLEDRLLIGPFELSGNKVLITRPLKAQEWRDQAAAERELTEARTWTLIVGSGVIAILLGFWLIRPIRRLSSATREIAEGSAEPDLAKLPHRRDEIGELARALAQTARDLATSRDAQRRLLSDISHELRSPMARMQVALDLTDAAQDDAHMQQLRRDTERLNLIIERILSLSKLENGLVTLQREAVNIGKLVEQLVADIRYVQPEAGGRLKVMPGNWPTIEADNELLRMTLENIVRNALHYTDDNVELSYDCNESHHFIRVRDYGPGVADDLLGKLFEPFYRGDPSRNHKAGVGLGLALSQRATAVLHGQLSAKNHPQGGLEVVLELRKTD